MAGDVRRQQREVDPIVGARDAVLDLHQRVERQRHAADRQRHHDIVGEPRLDRLHREETCACDHGRACDRGPAAAREKAAQEIEAAAFGVLRDEALRGGGEPQVGEIADQQHPGPDIDVDAELEGSEPAREHDLGGIDQRRAEHADHEGCARHALGDGAVAAVCEPGSKVRGQTPERKPVLPFGTLRTRLPSRVTPAPRTRSARRKSDA